MTLNHTFDDSLISDLYKDAYGSRPSQTYWTLWRSMTSDQKQGEWRNKPHRLLYDLVGEVQHLRSEIQQLRAAAGQGQPGPKQEC